MAHMTGLDHGPEMAALEQFCLQSLPESIPVPRLNPAISPVFSAD